MEGAPAALTRQLSKGEQQLAELQQTDNSHDYNWSNDPRNPHLWTKRRKVAMIVLVSCIGYVCTMGSTIYAPGREQVAVEFSVSAEASILPVSLFNIGMGLGPLIASPLSETFGRRIVYLVVLPLFGLFVLGWGFSSSLASLVICRFFAGVFASPSVAIAAATIADMLPPSQRAFPLIVYYTTPTLGALSGPLIGGFVISQKSWHWTAWVTLIFAVPVSLPLLFTRESYKKVLLARRNVPAVDVDSQSRQESPSKPPATSQLRLFITQNLGRPAVMLLTEPICSFLCLYMSFQFGLLYLFVVSSPRIYATTYGFDIQAQSLSFLGLLIGCASAPLLLIYIELRLYRPRLARSPEERLPPEERLDGAMVGSVLLPIGLFMFAFTARPSIPFYVPMVAQGIVMFGSLSVYIPAGMYLMETYGAKYGASASGANSLLRYALASTFPLFAPTMFARLGTAGATSVLGGFMVVMACIPWVLRKWGPELRRRSKYRVDD
ncbi:MFS transporter-like protein 107 [Elsinoe australis]|uniref:MFS transporter-like protein 107 n=1 Tax=Elsinoe australis TaxID=40998 RepID=A0A4V6DV33_9PEZI|nr:MFS transporter-like protein 107 [Elsinoe australis]